MILIFLIFYFYDSYSYLNRKRFRCFFLLWEHLATNQNQGNLRECCLADSWFPRMWTCVAFFEGPLNLSWRHVIAWLSVLCSAFVFPDSISSSNTKAERKDLFVFLQRLLRPARTGVSCPLVPLAVTAAPRLTTDLCVCVCVWEQRPWQQCRGTPAKDQTYSPSPVSIKNKWTCACWSAV